jgi:hypothetical protein
LIAWRTGKGKDLPEAKVQLCSLSRSKIEITYGPMPMLFPELTSTATVRLYLTDIGIDVTLIDDDTLAVVQTIHRPWSKLLALLT